jgi:hypothetical protein
MNSKRIILLVLFAMTLNALGQTKTKEDIKIKIVKAKLADNVSVFGIRQLRVTDNDLRKVLVKTKIESTTENKAKLSGFSLLDTTQKFRYRLADYKGYTGFVGFPELIPFRKDKIFNDKGKEINGNGWPSYDENENDYFNKFDIEGYRNVEVPINFGSASNPKLSIVYFGETDYKNFTAELFFTIYEVNADSNYELYYNDQKVGDIKFE